MIVQQKTFKSYDKLEQYFINEILPNPNLSSKVIGKKLLFWEKPSNRGGPRVPGPLE
jgi:hypothetical protein